MGAEWKRVAADAFRPQQSALDLRVALAGSLATAVPLLVGRLLDDPHAGLAAALGGFNVVLAMPVGGGLRHRLWWGAVTLVVGAGAVATGAAVAPYAALSMAVALAWTAGWALLRAAATQGAVVGFIVAAMFVIFNGRPTPTGAGALTAQFAIGGFAGLVLMMLAGLRVGAGEPRRTASAAEVLATVASAVRRDRVLVEHVVRVGVTIAVATVLYRALGLSFGYWIPLTALAILQPDGHSGRVRALQRAAGTLIGVAAVVLVTTATADHTVLTVLVAIAAFGLFALKERSYYWMVALLTPTALLMISTADFKGSAIAGQRVMNTAIGIAIALIAMHVVLPVEERVKPAKCS